MPSSSSSSSSSGEDRRLKSVVVEFVPHKGAHCHPSSLPNERHGEADPPHLKLYQTRVQDLLYGHLDKTFAWHFEEENGGEKSLSNGTHEDDLGFHLFSRAPPGVSVKQSPKGQPLKKRRLIVAKEDKKVGKEFKLRLEAVAVDGATIKVEAEKANAKLLARYLNQEKAKEEAEKAEKERIALMKRERGERWLPSMAKELRDL